MEHTSNIMTENIETFKQMSVCRGCLARDRRMISATRYEPMYRDLTGLIISPSDGLPQWLCYECSALLEKYVTLRNRMIKSHYTLYKYVTESIPFAFDEIKSSHLTQTSITHYKIPGVKIEQLEEQIKLDILEVKAENDYDDNITIEEWRFEDHLNKLTSNSPILELKHDKERDQGEDRKCQICSAILENSEVLTDHYWKTHNVRYVAQKKKGDEIVINDEPIEVLDEYDFDNDVQKIEVDEHITDQQYSDTETTQAYSERVLAEDISRSIGEQDSAQHPESRFIEIYMGRVVDKSGVGGARVPEKPALTTHTRDAEDITSTPFSEDCTGIIDSDVRDSSSLCSNIQSYICDKCKKVFNDKILLIAHIRGHSVTEFKPNKCDVCLQYFRHKSTLIRHYRVHTGDKPYKCDVCMKRFTRKGNLDTHHLIHTNDKPYKCDVCTKRFTLKATLDTHYRIHTGDKPYKCDVCLQCFRHKITLVSHYHVHTGNKPYKCDVCMNSFTHKGHLDRHCRQHTDDKAYKCDICMNSFTQKSSLDKHYRVHSGNKPYKCDVCLQCFRLKREFNRHYRVHTGNKLYKCDVCMNSYTNKGNLDRHCRQHTGDKAYKCDVCTKTFTQKGTLDTHYRIHTGDKPYKCDVCLKCFRHKSSLNVHYRKHTGD